MSEEGIRSTKCTPTSSFVTYLLLKYFELYVEKRVYVFYKSVNIIGSGE